MKRFEFKIQLPSVNAASSRKGCNWTVHAKTFTMAVWLLEGILPHWAWKFTPVYTGHTEMAASGKVINHVGGKRIFLVKGNRFLGLV
jgi:hypothetical protein